MERGVEDADRGYEENGGTTPPEGEFIEKKVRSCTEQSC
jgi:hypothetical protein